jgi:hypothetical protein
MNWWKTKINFFLSEKFPALHSALHNDHGLRAAADYDAAKEQPASQQPASNQSPAQLVSSSPGSRFLAQSCTGTTSP